MWFRLIRRALTRRRGGRLLIAAATGLGACVATAMLSVVLDVGDKVNAELTAYGANIVVRPKTVATVGGLYDTSAWETAVGAWLAEDEVAGIKNIFWGFNIVSLAPFLETAVVARDAAGGELTATLTGTWFQHQLETAPDTTAVGVVALKSWWRVEGGWTTDQDQDQVMAGAGLAERAGWAVGDNITLQGAGGGRSLRLVGLITSGEAADDQFWAPLAVAQALAGRPGQVDRVEVAALTTPENDLARRAARDPSSLTVTEWETWYCTAYASSIAYQIEEVMPGAVAKPVRQITAVQGEILTKTESLMLLVTGLALLASALAIANLVTASVMERSAEIGLLKALGASSRAIAGLLLAELLVVGLAGGAVGYGLGLGCAQLVGRSVFAAWITPRPAVVALVGLGVAAVVVVGSLPALRLLLRLRPADVLHGR
ncbi:MAG: ABC transporter permease [Propionibacteriaceae bacterium]|jgi:putative ABC transport system permease protein|nr:ABC transporter permease [Propionibacteriaceae bacterium]